MVDLTRGTFETRSTFDYVPTALGGRGLGAALAWEMLRPDMGPFDADAPLMFLNGPLSGTTAPSAGRLTICALSPQSTPIHWFSRASMGGNVGHHLKYAGYDGVILTGQAPRPVYLWISDSGPELRDAGELWGQGIMATQAALQATHGAKAQVACIGPAGETRSAVAVIGCNDGSAAGQGGFGAVMGAKNLKALAVLGTGRVTLHDQAGFRALSQAIARELMADNEKRGGRPQPAGAYGVRRDRCSTGCINGCRTHYEGVPGVLQPERTYEGIVQCTSGRFRGAKDHYWDLGFEAGFELNMLANDWGINHWDMMKGLFPWIGMCHTEGLLPDINGRPVELNAPHFWYEVLQAIATRQGPMAEIVADGGRQAIARTGLLPEVARQLYTGWGYANHWDGRGPRGNQIMYPFWLVSALYWMVETRDPMGSTHAYVQDMLRASPFGGKALTWEQLKGIGDKLYGRPEAMDPLSNYEGKAGPALWHLQASIIKDSLPLCDRVYPRLFSSLSEDGIPRADGVEGTDFEARLLALVTGYDVSTEELHRLGERALTLERAEQMRDFGRIRALEAPVLDFFCETTEEYLNPLLPERKRAEIGPLTALADEFYALRQWDPVTGHPTPERFASLGLQREGAVAIGGRS
jgi:aldehyde:ferredoxin oxidoreductase